MTRACSPAAWTALGALALTAAVLAAFLPSLAYGFAPIDDEKNFLDNPYFRGLGPERLRWMLTTRHTGHFIPVTWLTLGLDYTLWGLRPFGYHLTSLLLHLATALAFYLLAVRLLRDGTRPLAAVAGGLAAALFFAVHPLRVESVVWISERRDVVCGLFSMLTLHAYVSMTRASGARRRLLLLTVALFAAALLSKGIAVALLPAFVALDATLLRRLPPDPALWWRPEHRPVVLEKAGLLAVGLLSAAVTLSAIGYVLAPMQAMGPAARVATMVYGLVFYLQKTVFPHPLPLVIYHAGPPSLASPEIAVRAVLVAAAAAALLAWRHRVPGLLAAAAAYAAFVLPVSGLFQAGPQLVAHRYSYHACWPWALLLGWALGRWLDGARLGARAAVAAAAGLAACVALLALTRAQSALWRDPLTFATAAAEASPAAWQPRYTLAGIHLRAGRWPEAARQLRSGLARNPTAAPLLNMAALLFATCPDDRVRSGPEAAVLAGRVLSAVGDDAWALLTFSAALAENREFRSAAIVARRALVAAGSQPGPEPAARLRAALALYEAGRPLRMGPSDWGQDRLGP